MLFCRSNYRILYYTWLRLFGKNFVMFVHIDWKLLAFKVEEKVFFHKHVLLARKTKSSITFTSLIQMEWIKASHLDKKTIYKEKIKIKIFSFFCEFFFAARSPPFFGYCCITFAPGHRLKQKLYFWKAHKFSYLMRKFHKVS